MVAARIPAMITPARSGWKRSCARLAKTFSAPLWERSAASVGKSFRPRIPIKTATESETTTQTVAIRRERVSSSPRRIAIKRSRTCGIPKYPSPQESVERIVRNP